MKCNSSFHLVHCPFPPARSVCLFVCFVLFCFVLFCFVLFCLVLFSLVQLDLA